MGTPVPNHLYFVPVDPATGIPYVIPGGSTNLTATVKATAAAPTYVEGTSANPLSSDLSGNLRIAGSFSATAKSTAADPTYIEGATGNPFSVDLAGYQRSLVKGTVSLGAGAATIGALTANQSVNLTQVGGNAFSTGNGASGNGVLRVTLASDSTGQVALAAGTATVGGVVAKPSAAANGLTRTRVVSAATTNATNLKASAGNIYRIHLFNLAAYDVFLKLYDKASAPTVGTDTPVWTIPIKSGGSFSEVFNLGESFPTGIAYAITKLLADSDTTAIAANDVTGSITWI
jgi:hypothetical protein